MPMLALKLRKRILRALEIEREREGEIALKL